MIYFNISYRHGFKDYGLFLHSAKIIGKELEDLSKKHYFRVCFYSYDDMEGEPFKFSVWMNDDASEEETKAFIKAVLRAVAKSGTELHKLKGKVVDYGSDLRGDTKGFVIYVSEVE